MTYQFDYRTTAFDMWQLAMYHLYGSLVGVCNLIFTAAMFVLSIKLWGEASEIVKILLGVGCSLFTVMQPIAIFLRAKRQVRGLPDKMHIGFDDAGIHVETSHQRTSLKWQNIKRISRKPGMIVIFSNTTHGFVLTNQVLGVQKELFYAYIVSKIQ